MVIKEERKAQVVCSYIVRCIRWCICIRWSFGYAIKVPYQEAITAYRGRKTIRFSVDALSEGNWTFFT